MGPLFFVITSLKFFIKIATIDFRGYFLADSHFSYLDFPSDRKLMARAFL